MHENDYMAGPDKVFIVGSCVTRDPFELPGHRYRIENYVARSSFACSMRSQPFPVPPDAIDPEGAVSSSWQRRMVEVDLTRGLKAQLRAVADPEATVLVVDFIDERFHLLALGGEFATHSVELQRTDCAQRVPGISIVRTASEEHFDLWHRGFRDFVAEARSVGLEPVLNRVWWATETSDGSPLREPEDYILASNDYLGRLYNAADALAVPSIDYGATRFIARADHRWGPAPFHYLDDVYARFLSELDRLTTIVSRPRLAAAK
jgi:hypothetical protein